MGSYSDYLHAQYSHNDVPMGDTIAEMRKIVYT